MPSRLQSLQTGPVYRAIRYAAIPEYVTTRTIRGGAPRGAPPDCASDAPPLGRPGPVVGDGGDVRDGRHRQSGGLERADRRLPARARAAHEDLDGAHPLLHGLARGRLGGDPRGVRRTLPRALEAAGPGGAPGKGVPVWVRDGHDGVVEGRLDVGVAAGHYPPLTAPLTAAAA